MPKKTLCFDRSNMRNKTSINPKKGQHISGQDNSAMLKKVTKNDCSYYKKM